MEEQDRKKVSVFEYDEIPYEVRMKHLIEGYRRDLKRLDQLARYAKGLEEENLLLQKKIENTEKWIKSHPDKEELIRKMDLEIRQLKGTLTKSYPKRVVEPHDDSIVIAWMGGEGFTMKYLDLTHRKDGYIELRPANPDYPALKIDDPDNFQVWVQLFT